MTILVSIDCASGIVKRFDASKPEGLTHVGKLVLGEAGGDELAIREFLLMPPDSLSPHGETRLLPPPKELTA